MASPQKQLAADDIVSWLTPTQALQILNEVYGDNFLSKDTLLGRLRASTVLAIAENTVVYGVGTITHPINAIYPEEWRRIDTSDNGWITGDFRYERRRESGVGHENVSHHSVRFDPQGVRDIIKNAAPAPKPSAAQPKSSEATNNGGRPRKEWWDDFWIEICRQIWMGDLKPGTQADLERAMFEWVENHRNGEVGDTTIKAAARKLFKAWSLGSKT
jgi:hypothetical protein